MRRNGARPVPEALIAKAQEILADLKRTRSGANGPSGANGFVVLDLPQGAAKLRGKVIDTLPAYTDEELQQLVSKLAP